MNLRSVSLLIIFGAAVGALSVCRGLAAPAPLNDDDIRGLSSLGAFEKKLSGIARDKICYYEFNYRPKENTGAARVSVVTQSDTGIRSTHLRPFISEKTQATSKVALANKVLAAVNGGYFNLSDGVSASYVTLGGKVAADPTQNKALTGNLRLQKYLPQIFDRSELRVLKNEKDKGIIYQICAHGAALPAGSKLLDALQGGPALLPHLTASAEAFLRKEGDGSLSDSIGVKRTAARTAVGITAEGRIVIISCAGPKQDEFSSGLNLADVAQLLARLGCVQAINFDGGTSTTLVVARRRRLRR